MLSLHFEVTLHREPCNADVFIMSSRLFEGHSNPISRNHSGPCMSVSFAPDPVSIEQMVPHPCFSTAISVYLQDKSSLLVRPPL